MSTFIITTETTTDKFRVDGNPLSRFQRIFPDVNSWASPSYSVRLSEPHFTDVGAEAQGVTARWYAREKPGLAPISQRRS